MVERGDAVAAAQAGQASTVLQVGAGLADGDLGDGARLSNGDLGVGDLGDSEVKGM